MKKIYSILIKYDNGEEDQFIFHYDKDDFQDRMHNRDLIIRRMCEYSISIEEINEKMVSYKKLKISDLTFLTKTLPDKYERMARLKAMELVEEVNKYSKTTRMEIKEAWKLSVKQIVNKLNEIRKLILKEYYKNKKTLVVKKNKPN